MSKRFSPGELIGEYRVERFLGAGGMGEVYHGVHTKLGRPAAIKVLSATSTDATFTARFFNEARLQATLQHPNIASLYDFQECNGQLCIFMEFIDGESLEDLVERRAFAVEDALHTFKSIVEAIIYIHSNGVIHRDIKAANVKLTNSGTVKMLDFGIAKDAASNKMTQTGGVVGTPYYLAPEQMNGAPASPQTDIWALGVLFYEMLTGVVPFQAESLGELCHRITSVTFTPPEDVNPAVPRSVARIVNRCLKRNSQDRYQTAQELLADVQKVIAADKMSHDKTSAATRAFGFLTKAAAPAPPTYDNYSNNSGNYAQPENAYQNSYADEYAPPPVKRPLPVAMIAGAVAVAVVGLFAVVGVIAFMMSGGSPTPKTPNAPNPIVSGNQKPPANQAVVISSGGQQTTSGVRRVKVDVDEGKAQVIRNGSPVGQTPYDLEATIGERIDLTLRREGFEDKTVQLEISSGKQAYTFALKPK